MRKTIIKLISNNTNLPTESIINLLEIPPKEEMGDFAFPCFTLAKTEKKSPLLISQELTEKLKNNLPKEIIDITYTGAYVNFFTNKTILAEKIINETKKDNWGILELDNKKIGIEYPAPNTNKPLHVGHLRNMAIGDSITNITQTTGNKIYHLNLYNDRGILISKSMTAYLNYGNNTTPETENISGDKFVGKFYVLFNEKVKDNPKLEEEAKELLKKWESGDKETIKLWTKMNNWTYEGILKTFNTFGLKKIDKNYHESKMYKEGKEIVEEGLKKGIFSKKDGAIIINLEKDKLGEKVLLRSDGTSVYITQDIFLAEKKIKDFNLDSSYYIVGNDQIYHFQVLFTILEKLGIKKDWKHFAYGMVTLPSGKMKSRDGTAKSADDFIKDTKQLAIKGLKERSLNLTEKELEIRGLTIALAAIKYFLLKVDIKKNIVFNPKEALAFEGNTGPYLLYSYARANSITKKAKIENSEIKILEIHPLESSLIKKINSFPETIEKSYKQLAPNIIANYSFELAQTFNEFYHTCPVMNSKQSQFRLELVKAFKITLQKSLALLGIETLEEM